MLQSIVGPPLKGVADFKSSENPKTDNSKDEKNAGSDSFSQMLKRDEAKPYRSEKTARAESTKPIREKIPDKADRKDPEEVKRPESDEKVEKLAATKDNGAEKKAKGNSQRENAILNFMDSFESEFGVPPTRIVEAMANLKPTDQVEAPEATADQVIDQLGLDDQQEDQAKEMYVGLLAQLAQLNQNSQPALPEAPPPVTAGAIGAGAGERSAMVQEKRQILNNSLDTMNQKFWMKGANAGHATGMEGDLADKLAQMNMQDKLLQPQGLQIDDSLRADRFAEMANPTPSVGLQKPPLLEAQGQEEESQAPQATLAALVAAARAAKGRAEMKEMSSEFEETSAISKDPASSTEALQPKSHANGEALNVVEGSAQNPNQGFEFSKNQQQQENLDQSQYSTAKGEILGKTKSAEKSDFKKTLGLEGLQAPAPLKQDALAGTVAAAPVMVAPSKAENEANVRQLMNQAQYLIKKGGGEMKVEMTPEGLGKINMKVLVQDGKVNVQMVAETQEAKKNLESSLSDLKNSLAAHKLSMDHVKIDIVGGANTENNTQNQMNQNPGSRDQTRQFWNNFSENFGSPNQRDGFTDVPSLRGYPRPRSDQGLEPVSTASVNPYATAGKGKGLNLVA